MSGKRIVGAWCAALAIVCLAMVLVMRVAPADETPFGGAPVILIGSSLLAHGVAESGGGDVSLLGDGRRHHRIAASSIGEVHTLELADAALQGGAQTVFLEIDAFIKSFHAASRGPDCADWPGKMRETAWQARAQFLRSFRWAIGIGYAGKPEPELPGFKNQSIFSEWQWRRFYPLKLHDPVCRAELHDLAVRAQAHGTQLVFILPPRSQYAHIRLGAAQSAELAQRAAALAAEIDVPLFAPHNPWPDEEFTDPTHLNGAGRVHFTAALGQWWRSGHD